MAHWFHRNPLKATTKANFELRLIVSDAQAVTLCSELRQCRHRLLDHLSDPNNETGTLDAAFEKYLSLLYGFVAYPVEGGGESKLRYAQSFRWTQSLLGNAPATQKDAMYELVSVCQNVGIWFMKHAAVLAGKDEISMDEAKDVHTCLRKSAGLFSAMRDKYIGSLLQTLGPGSDLDSAVMNAYISQCTAEAQEVTIARAIELKHASSLISTLGNETSKLYATAANYLENLKPDKTGKWKKYLELKSTFYLAYAYYYSGENLLSREECGDAIRALQESEKCYADVRGQCKEYAYTSGVGMNAKPEANFFFRKLGNIIKRTLEKCERENGFIFHQRVPEEPVPLESKEKGVAYGLASPIEFHLPSISSLWTPVAYAAFDSFKPPVDETAAKGSPQRDEYEIPPVHEVDVHPTGEVPKNESGCLVQ